MKRISNPFREDMIRIQKELKKLQSCTVHIGIMGDAGSDVLHQYIMEIIVPVTSPVSGVDAHRRFPIAWGLLDHIPDGDVVHLDPPSRKTDHTVVAAAGADI